MPNTLAQGALHYVDLGLAVLPIHTPMPPTKCSCGRNCGRSRGKHPRVRISQASTDARRVLNWWKRWPDANIGIVTGIRSGIVALDVDGTQGAESLASLEKAYSQLPRTLTVSTGGGHHYYFRYPPALLIDDSTSEIAPGIDIRAEGGYVIAPPSLHPNGKHYEWVGEEPGTRSVADAPGWLIHLMVEPPGLTWDPSQPIRGEQRQPTLLSLASSLRRRGFSDSEVTLQIILFNREQCEPSLDEVRVRELAEYVCAFIAPRREDLVHRVLRMFRRM